METGICQEPNHPSASPRYFLLPHARELFFDFRRCRVGSRILILLALPLGDVVFHFFLVAHVEGERAVYLFQAQRRVMRPDGLRRLAILELTRDVRQRHTAPDEVEAPMPAFNELLGHPRTCLQSIPARWCR
jgi:hypothetical protein